MVKIGRTAQNGGGSSKKSQKWRRTGARSLDFCKSTPGSGMESAESILTHWVNGSTGGGAAGGARFRGNGAGCNIMPGLAVCVLLP